jgi:hypothetical protein
MRSRSLVRIVRTGRRLRRDQHLHVVMRYSK